MTITVFLSELKAKRGKDWKTTTSKGLMHSNGRIKENWATIEGGAPPTSFGGITAINTYAPLVRHTFPVQVLWEECTWRRTGTRSSYAQRLHQNLIYMMYSCQRGGRGGVGWGGGGRGLHLMHTLIIPVYTDNFVYGKSTSQSWWLWQSPSKHTFLATFGPIRTFIRHTILTDGLLYSNGARNEKFVLVRSRAIAIANYSYPI